MELEWCGVESSGEEVGEEPRRGAHVVLVELEKRARAEEDEAPRRATWSVLFSSFFYRFDLTENSGVRLVVGERRRARARRGAPHTPHGRADDAPTAHITRWRSASLALFLRGSVLACALVRDEVVAGKDIAKSIIY